LRACGENPAEAFRHLGAPGRDLEGSKDLYASLVVGERQTLRNASGLQSYSERFAMSADRPELRRWLAESASAV
jgi:hypothetical protein